MVELLSIQLKNINQQAYLIVRVDCDSDMLQEVHTVFDVRVANQIVLISLNDDQRALLIRERNCGHQWLLRYIWWCKVGGA